MPELGNICFVSHIALLNFPVTKDSSFGAATFAGKI